MYYISGSIGSTGRKVVAVVEVMTEVAVLAVQG